MTLRRLAPLLFLALVAAGPTSTADIDPPPPPPAPGQQPPPPPQGFQPEDKTVDLYQKCLQKMIDAGATDNSFMRRCLGLPERPAASSPRHGGTPEALGRAEVVSVVDRNLPALRECYNQLLTRSAGLGLVPEGEVAPHFEILPDGSIEGLAFDATSLADVGLLGCFRDRMRAWAFPRTTGKEKLGVRLSFRLSRPRGAKTGVVALAKGFPVLKGGASGLSAEEVANVFRRGAPGVRTCYEELLKRHSGRQPAPQGAAIAELGVGADGHVTKVGFPELTVEDEVFRNCIALQLKRWRFPRPHGGEPVTVRSPRLLFAPTAPAHP